MSVVVAPSPAATIAAGVIWPPLCAILVALRFYTRRVQHLDLFVDDWLTIPALLMTIGMGAALVVGVERKALAYPTPRAPDPKNELAHSAPEIVITRQVEWALELMQILGLTSVKLSFIFFYRRIFCIGSGGAFNSITWTVIVIITGWGVSFFFGLLFVCGTHVSAFWTSIQSLNTYCHPTLDLEQAFAISDFFTDLIVLILPLPLIWRLQMAIGRKLAILGVFLLGALAVAASITRMVIFIKAVRHLKSDYSGSGANDFIVTSGLYWSMIESGLGLTAACLPTLYWLVKKTCSSNFFSVPFRRKYGSMESDICIVPDTARSATINSHAMKNVGSTSNLPRGHEGRIVIEKSIERTEDSV